MLRAMALADQWRTIESGLPDGWGDARVLLTIADAGNCDRAAAMLGPANPWRGGKTLRFHAARNGSAPSPEAVRRLLRRLDYEGIAGELELVSSDAAVARPETVRTSLAASWQAALETLPSDWSDVYAEIELASSDHLERCALLLAPVNPARHGSRPGYRFRCARRFGYGASPGMVARCLERCDAEKIRGEVRIVRALSDTHNAYTQGPVWYLGGKAV